MSCSKPVPISPFFKTVNGYILLFTFDEADESRFETRYKVKFGCVDPNYRENIGIVVIAIKKFTTSKNTLLLPNTNGYSCFYEMRETKDGIKYTFQVYISSKEEYGYITYYKCVPREKFLELYNEGSLADTSEYVERVWSDVKPRTC